jgi:predicted Zn-dependent protease
LVSNEVNTRQQNLFSRYKALLEGDSKNTFIYEQMEYNITPLDIETNSSMMTIALQVVNRPQAVDTIYSKISMDDIDLRLCDYCEDRYFVKALTDIELQNYDGAIKLLGKFANDRENNKLRKILIRAEIKKGNFQKADSLLINVQSTAENIEWMEVFLFNAKDLLLQDQQELANKYLGSVISMLENTSDSLSREEMQLLAESLFLSEKYQKAEQVLTKLVHTYPDVIGDRALLAISLQRNGNIEEAKRQLNALDKARGPYQYGSVDYALAQYYATISDEANLFKYLTRAISAGHWYSSSSFQNDPLLKKYTETDAFERVMNFWN